MPQERGASAPPQVSGRAAAALPRTLVFCSAGERLHQLSWLRGLDRQEAMDAAIVCYAAPPPDAPPPCKYFLANQDFKLPNFLRLLSEHESVLDYELFMFIDDDIVLSAEDLGRWRQVIASEGLDVSQPALSPQSKADWPHLWFRAGLDTDREQFVEIQCFALSRRALRAALPYFFMVKTGFGLDIVLFHLCSTGQLTSAVVHQVQMLHPHRPEAQTVRQAYADFAPFKRHLLRLLDFCFADPNAFANLTVASHLLGDTRPATVRWVRSTRYIAGRLARKFRRMLGRGA